MQEAADFYSHQLKHNKQVLNYLEKRGFDNDIIKHFKLSYAPKASHLSRYLMEGTKFDSDDLKTLSLINQDDKTALFVKDMKDLIQSTLSDNKELLAQKEQEIANYPNQP
ncbi:MAG: hypothetical protein QS2022_2000 [Candidatus Phytoplasma asteris]|uniref:DNA primase n=1 Tax='Chrysanthemum coronarium' phytoplasma TaxID=1520703 RepID=A0ABQ0J2W9_9MOLU|nr:hypothetical protein ['Chrysanthemum coronarium' phytoplasma]WEX19478.1 MAG: hypothetical protein QS2022_2000 [Candidatus Phytoplasma asteris]GAK73944.1 DNA primase ['Chrysanthemum coronarium' phytoplasma]